MNSNRCLEVSFGKNVFLALRGKLKRYLSPKTFIWFCLLQSTWLIDHVLEKESHEMLLQTSQTNIPLECPYILILCVHICPHRGSDT